ncbi:hypothetical protein D1631_04015 [Chryseobacterium nematophagum]|uniref:Transposase n=1 Tax=Chryseobacterium nematophagum TaxID=2305228 RepID=A0A3M7TET8_9FLAO|nr:hypothetical protein [Chryseobacterium nematophagum]RNA61159.1 hypothetical protein D1631_04015 [Chryseobacterium nematophagum]
MITDQELLKLLLPEFLVQHFDIAKVETQQTELHIYFEEKAIVPKEYSDRFQKLYPPIIPIDCNYKYQFGILRVVLCE